jgi:hypothetical protein
MRDTTDEGLERLVAELIAVGGMFARILDHMEAFAAAGRCAPDIPPREVVLQCMLGDILRPKLRGRRQSQLDVTTKMLKRIASAIESELLLVSPDFLDGDPDMN